MAKQRKAVEGVYERVPGSGIWYARTRVDGKLLRKSFKTAGRGNPGFNAAVAWIEKARTVKRTGEGVLPSTAKRPVLTTAEVAVLGNPDAIKVSKLCDEFEKYVKRHPEEYRDQKNPPKRIAKIKAAFGDRIAETLKSSEIEDWLDEIQEDRELANATINKLRGTFSMIYRHGKRKDLTDVNPASDVPLRDVGNGIERYLSEAEEKRLREVLQADIDSHDPLKQSALRAEAIHRLIEFEISLKTGMRRSEQYNLRWSDVDFDRKVMRLRMTKNGTPRNAFIIDDVERALRQLMTLKITRRDRSKAKPNILKMRDMVFAKSENAKWWNAALDKAKIENYRWHDNRHSFCSRLVMAGVHLKVVQEAAGHASIVSTMRYAHLGPNAVLDAMAVLNSSMNQTQEKVA